MTRLAFALAVLLTAVSAHAQPSVEEPLDVVLGSIVQPDGRVDYDLLAGDLRETFDLATDAIGRYDRAGLDTDAERTAFLINAYNAHVLWRVLDHPEAENLERQDLFRQFFRVPVAAAGVTMTLDQLEHGILRRQDRANGAPVLRLQRALRPSRVDYRIHAALNCAAVSCPPLADRAYRAETLDRDLDARWEAFLASPRAARIDGRLLVLSSIFDWFAEDFEADGRPLGDVLLADMPRQRADALRPRLAGRSAADLRDDPRVVFAYDWTVNRAR